MRDGTTLAADVYLPDCAGPWPTLVLYFPYSKDLWMGVRYANYLAYFASHGYAAVVADFRGTGASEGVMPDAFAAIESSDVYDLVEGLADQPWCDGSVGMWGVSYGGISALRAAAARPPHLRAVVAVEGSTDPYAHEVMRSGVPGLAMVVAEWATLMLCVNALPPVNGVPRGEPEPLWDAHLDALTPWHFAWRGHPTRDDYWQGRDVDPARIDVPTMIVTSWRDTNPHGAWRDYEALSGPRRIIAGPWQHGLPDEADTDPIHTVGEMRRWFDIWLRSEQPSDDPQPPVNVFVLGADRWESYDRWPLRTRALTLFLGADGTLDDVPDSRQARTPVAFDATVGIHGGLGMAHAPEDQRGDDQRSTLFTTHPLDQPVDIVGQISLRLNVEFTEPDTDIAVRVVDLVPDGGSALIAKGYLRLSNPAGCARLAVSPPAADVTVECNPTRYRVAAGHRIRLALAAADFPEVWPVRAPADYSVAVGGDVLSASRMILHEPIDRPVGRPEFEAPDRDLVWRQRRPRVSTLSVSPPDADGIAAVVGSVATSTETFDGHRVDVSHEYKISTSARRSDRTQLSTTSTFRVQEPHRTVAVDASTYTGGDVAAATVSVAVDGVTVFADSRRHRPRRASRGDEHAPQSR
jgi:predicted acyl esterase